MDYMTDNSWQERGKSMAAVIMIHAIIGYALVSGMGMQVAKTVTSGFKVIHVTPPLPQEPVPAAQPAEAVEEAASPENAKAVPTQIVAPEPEIRLKPESPVIAAPVAGPGNESQAGAADRPGPGFGSGGQGDGYGGGGIVSGPRHLSGALTRKDIPRSVWQSATRGEVVVRFTVGADGRASDCTVRQSSGHPALDSITCRLIEERFRFEPARNERGLAVASPYGWIQEWWRDGRGPRRVK